ncbi:MAG: hypothetical protein FWF46_00435 [Oscillospiraceae bacterium]|nr:hypothetical protein [Oscillospiraceae bacterium]
MNCYNHEEKEAVAQCSDCGKGLCKECAEKYQAVNLIICDDCASARNNYDKGTFTKTIVMAVVAFVIGLVISIVMGLPAGGLIVFSILTACVPFGWRVLTKVTPKLFLFMPVIRVAYLFCY